MSIVSIRDLRNHGGEVIERARLGEHITITKDGVPAAVLLPVSPRSLSAEVLVARRRNLPRVDPERLRADLDADVDSSL
jgi:prevent-host-death family protein